MKYVESRLKDAESLNTKLELNPKAGHKLAIKDEKKIGSSRMIQLILLDKIIGKCDNLTSKKNCSDTIIQDLKDVHLHDKEKIPKRPEDESLDISSNQNLILYKRQVCFTFIFILSKFTKPNENLNSLFSDPEEVKKRFRKKKDEAKTMVAKIPGE